MNIAVQTRRTDEEAFADRRIPKGGDWLSREELAALTPEELVRRTTALKPLVAAHAAECESLRRPVDAVWDAIRKSGVFYHFVPRRYGGLEFDIDSFIDAMLPIAEVKSSSPQRGGDDEDDDGDKKASDKDDDE